MLNFGASKSRVKGGGPGARPPRIRTCLHDSILPVICEECKCYEIVAKRKLRSFSWYDWNSIENPHQLHVFLAKLAPLSKLGWHDEFTGKTKMNQHKDGNISLLTSINPISTSCYMWNQDENDSVDATFQRAMTFLLSMEITFTCQRNRVV